MSGLMQGPGAVDMQALFSAIQGGDRGIPAGAGQVNPLQLISELVMQGGGGAGGAGKYQTAFGADPMQFMQGMGQPQQAPMQQRPTGGIGVQPVDGPAIPPAIQSAMNQKMQEWEALRAEGMLGNISDEEFMGIMLDDVQSLLQGVPQ